MIIKVENLQKIFKTPIKGKGIKNFFFPKTKDYKAVNDINFEVEKGEIIGFVGPNGAGKSTTIKMLTGIIHPTSGSISVAGLNPVIERKALAYKIGCMFGQRSSLWMHLPAIDTYKLLGAIYDIPKIKIDKKIREIIELFGIKNVVNIPVKQLSLGQRMICEIAAVMLHEPEIIFLDEPTIGLDIVVKEKIRKIILDLNKAKNTTIFLTSHDIGDVEKICDRVVIIDEGKIIKDEKIETLKRDYLTEKIINLTYEDKINTDGFPYHILSNEENKVIIQVDTKKTNISKVMEDAIKLGNLVDMESMNVPLEQIIYDIYT